MIALMALVGVALSSLVLFDPDPGDQDDPALNGNNPAEPQPETIPVDAILNEDTLTGADTSSDAMGTDPLVRFGGPSGTLVLGANADDLLDGEGGDDTLRAADGDDTLHGGTGDDTLFGENGNDRLLGQDGDDILIAGTGDDALFGGAGHDALYGDAGDDQLHGYLGDDTLVGGAGADVLFGGAGNDILDGRDDTTDTLLGGSGDDTLIAGSGDHLSGGAGADIFALTANNSVDDYDPTTDQIEVMYEGTPPALSTQVSDAGLVLLADGDVVATFADITALDLTQVRLVAA